MNFIGLFERHFCEVVGVGANLEFAGLKMRMISLVSLVHVIPPHLGIQRKCIKPHGTDEIDMSGLDKYTGLIVAHSLNSDLRVHDLLVLGDPQPGMFGQHLNHL